MSSEPLTWEPDGWVVGITGGIACGKSTVGRILESHGWTLADADQVAHEAIQPDGPAYRDVVRQFGEGILRPDRTIDRGLLGRQVFSDEQKRAMLNGLVHPHVRLWRDEWMKRMRKEQRVAGMIIPLLFEVGAVDGWNAILCVSAPEKDIRERLRQRGLTDHDADARLAAQWPLREKVQRADFVIENDQTTGILEERVLQWSNMILKKES